MVYDNGQLTTYLDCQQVDQRPVNIVLFNDFYIGQFVSPSLLNWQGKIDEFSVYDYARGLGQIMAEKACRRTGAEPGLILYLPLDQGAPGQANPTETTAIDQSSAGNDGTLGDFALTGQMSNWRVEDGEALGAVSMVIDRNDRMWFGGATGLYYIDSVSTIAAQPSLHLRPRQKKCLVRAIPAAYVAALLLKNDTLIVGHQAGVSLINVNDTMASPTAITFPLGAFMGMTEQNALLIDRLGKLWVGADNGAALIDLNVFGRERGMQGKLEIAITGGTGPVAPDWPDHFSLPLADRAMTHSYQIPIADRFAEAITADVLLSNQRGDTLSFFQNLPSGDPVRTPHLYPGTYTLQTNLFTNNQLLESRVSTIKVPFHLTERWWFWTILAAAIVGFVYFVQRARIKRQALIAQLTRAQLDLSETRREKDRMQISTLAGTINPHFISNAIEWLQSAYLVKRPIEKMDEMAENLSDVIRMIFTKAFAETPSHSLKTELGLVERYFRTVNIQYDEAYDFRLPPQEDIDALGHHEVLLMQLQVHVENAVEHGLRYRNKANKVSIQLSQDDDYIYATVADDGAGVDYVRKKQAEMNRRDGVGTNIMRKLQNTFNQYNQLLLDTTINSPIATDEDGKPYGTRVTVVIPKHYSYALKSPGG